MPAAVLMTVEEYLHTSFEPECDYVEGRLIERHVGQKPHSKLQTRLAAYFFTRRIQLGIEVFTEQRLRVAPDRYRVPDLCVVRGMEPDENVFTTPPYLCIEILSPDDRASDLLDKVSDYLAFGVAFVWVIDPVTWEGWIYRADGPPRKIVTGAFDEPFAVGMQQL